MIVKMILSRTVDAANGAVFECAGRSMYVTKQAGGYGPRKIHPNTNLSNRQYLAQTAELRRWLKEESGLLLYFYRVDWRWYLPAAEELERILGLHVLARENDGVIYQAR